MRDFIGRYERSAETCNATTGYDLLKAEPKAMHLVQSSNLDKFQKEIILGSGENDSGELDYNKVKRNLNRLFDEN